VLVLGHAIQIEIAASHTPTVFLPFALLQSWKEKEI